MEGFDIVMTGRLRNGGGIPKCAGEERETEVAEKRIRQIGASAVVRHRLKK